MKGVRALVGAMLAVLAMVALAVPAAAAGYGGTVDLELNPKGRLLEARMIYTPNPKTNWDRVIVDYEVSVNGGAFSRKKIMIVSNMAWQREKDGTYTFETYVARLWPGTKVVVKFTNLRVEDAAGKVVATASDTTLNRRHRS